MIMLGFFFSFFAGTTTEASWRNQKPKPNAFMLFLKQQRKLLPSEMQQNGSGAVNLLLGKRVKVFLVSADQCSKKNPVILV